MATISIKHVIALLETQRYLQALQLPEVVGPPNISLMDFIPSNRIFPDLQHVRLHPSSEPTLDAELSQVVRRSPASTQLDLHFTNANVFLASRSAPSKRDLFTVATRLNLHGCEFSYHIFSAGTVFFPSLRALSIKDCQDSRYLLADLNPNELPFLEALSYTAKEYLGDPPLISFFRGLSNLRELLVRVPGLSLGDGSVIRQHAETLEILSLCCTTGGSSTSEFNATNDALFFTLSRLRHLNLHARNTWVQNTSSLGFYVDDVFNEFLVRLVSRHRAL